MPKISIDPNQKSNAQNIPNISSLLYSLHHHHGLWKLCGSRQCRIDQTLKSLGYFGQYILHLDLPQFLLQRTDFYNTNFFFLELNRKVLQLFILNVDYFCRLLFAMYISLRGTKMYFCLFWMFHNRSPRSSWSCDNWWDNRHYSSGFLETRSR